MNEWAAAEFGPNRCVLHTLCPPFESSFIVLQSTQHDEWNPFTTALTAMKTRKPVAAVCVAVVLESHFIRNTNKFRELFSALNDAGVRRSLSLEREPTTPSAAVRPRMRLRWQEMATDSMSTGAVVVALNSD